MKRNMHRLIIIFAIMFAATGAKAQKADKLHAEEGLFNHLSVGLSTGLSGTSIDVAMPVHKTVTVRAGIGGMSWGDIKFKAINTASEITQMQMVEEDAIKRAQMVDKVAGISTSWARYIPGKVYLSTSLQVYSLVARISFISAIPMMALLASSTMPIRKSKTTIASTVQITRQSECSSATTCSQLMRMVTSTCA